MSAKTIKICFIGHSNVGKSSILVRFSDDKFIPSDSATVGTLTKMSKLNVSGVDFKVKFINHEGTRYKLTLWDTAGQERFRTLTSSYYRDAHGVILVREFEELEAMGGNEVMKMVIGNKMDMVSSSSDSQEQERQVSAEEGAAMAGMRGALFTETSAKTRENVHTAMQELIAKIVASPLLNSPASPRISKRSTTVRLSRNNSSALSSPTGIKKPEELPKMDEIRTRAAEQVASETRQRSPKKQGCAC